MLVAHPILIVLVFGAIVVGLTPPVQAEPLRADRTDNRSVTLSGESLTNVESRTTEDDYRNFFPGNAPVSARENNTAPNSETPVVFTIDDQYEVIFGSPIEYPEYVEQFRSPGDTNSSQSVRVRIPVGESSTQ
jgi:hypothetical protein